MKCNFLELHAMVTTKSAKEGFKGWEEGDRSIKEQEMGGVRRREKKRHEAET